MDNAAIGVLVTAVVLAVEGVPLSIAIWRKQESIARLVAQIMGLTVFGSLAYFAADTIVGEKTAFFVIVSALGGALGARIPDGLRRNGLPAHAGDGDNEGTPPLALPPKAGSAPASAGRIADKVKPGDGEHGV